MKFEYNAYRPSSGCCFFQVHHRIDVWAGVTKSSFSVMSVEAATQGVDSSFTFSADILQTGRRPITVKTSMDLHEVCSLFNCWLFKFSYNWHITNPSISQSNSPSIPSRQVTSQNVLDARVTCFYMGLMMFTNDVTFVMGSWRRVRKS